MEVGLPWVSNTLIRGLASLFNEGYEDWLSNAEMKNLNLLFQKRYLLAHTEGIADADYLKKTGDSTYQVGQRIVVTAQDVRQLVELITKLENQIRVRCGK